MRKTLSAIAVTLLGVFSVITANAADITVKNAVGEQVVPQNPKRIVVLDYSVADTIRELGEKERIVGLPNGTIMPAYLAEFNDADYVNVGTLQEPAFEKINDLNPDLIIASGRQQKMLDRLKEIAPVFYWQTDFTAQYPSFQQNVLALGQILNKEQVAKEKLAVLDEKIANLAKLTKNQTALLILVNESKISVYGDTSRYAIVYGGYGFTPADKEIKSSTHGMSVGFEYVAEKNPDYLLVVDRTAAITEKTNNAQKVLDNAIINQTKAAQNKHIVYLDSANWYLAFGGLQSMAMMVQEVESAVKK